MLFRSVKKGLNVRQTEKLVKTDGGKASRPKKSHGGASTNKDPDTVSLERDLSNMLGLAVNIDVDGAAGKISIRYETLEQLDDILQRLTHGKASDLGSDEDMDESANPDENEFDSMFIEDDDSDGDSASASDGDSDSDDDLTAELENIADATLPEDDDAADEAMIIDGPEGDAPIESDQIGEDELDELIINDKA